jgi:hypothetical protein
VSTVADLNDFYDALTDGTLLSAEQLAQATVFVETGMSFRYGLGLGGVQVGCPDDPEEVFLGTLETAWAIRRRHSIPSTAIGRSPSRGASTTSTATATPQPSARRSEPSSAPACAVPNTSRTT